MVDIVGLVPICYICRSSRASITTTIKRDAAIKNENLTVQLFSVLKYGLQVNVNELRVSLTK